MALSDLPLDGLRESRGSGTAPEDFDAFWAKTLAEARAHDLDARFEPVDTGLSTVRVFDVTFAGFGGHPVKGWLTVPAGAEGPRPLAVQFSGCGGGRAPPHEHLLRAATGRGHFVMGAGGRGGGGGPGEVAAEPVGSGPWHPGFVTRGLGAPEDYYWRRVCT